MRTDEEVRAEIKRLHELQKRFDASSISAFIDGLIASKLEWVLDE